MKTEGLLMKTDGFVMKTDGFVMKADEDRWVLDASRPQLMHITRVFDENRRVCDEKTDGFVMKQPTGL